MKYTCEVIINKPLNIVVDLWENDNLFSEWQDGFKSITYLSHNKGEPGAKARILLESKNRKMELVETIIINDLPSEKKALYEHIHMTNTQSSRFIEVDSNTTRYISEVEYTKFNGFIPKLMGKIFPSIFKKQSQKWMNQFKDFVEKAH